MVIVQGVWWQRENVSLRTHGPAGWAALATPTKVMLVLSDSVIVVLPPFDVAVCNAVPATAAP